MRPFSRQSVRILAESVILSVPKIVQLSRFFRNFIREPALLASQSALSQQPDPRGRPEAGGEGRQQRQLLACTTAPLGFIKGGAFKVHVIHELGSAMNAYLGVDMLDVGLHRIGQDQNPGKTLGCVALS